MRCFIESVRSYKNGRNLLTLSDSIELLSLISKYDLDISASHII
ncbi:MAG: hypothetical protein WAW59_05475 [Patescibacteria group bacterium]